MKSIHIWEGTIGSLQQKPVQHYKAIILQLKTNFKNYI